MDSEIGLSVVDRFSHKFFEFINEATPDSTIQTFIDYLNPVFLGSTPVYRGDLFDRPADQIKIFDFIAVKPREGVESGIEECEFVYEKVKVKDDIADNKEIHKTPSERIIYKIDFQKKSSNKSILLILLIFIITSCLIRSTL